MKDLGIYVHIPFCKRKCNYCDFISFANKDNLICEYIKTLKEEIDKLTIKESEYLVETIYFGGGTPSYIESKYIVDILRLLKNKFNVSNNAEITIEINPGTVNKEKLEDYYKAGINRLSIGLQSVDDKMLKLIGRIHNYNEFLETYNLAKEVGFKNINIDLIIGLPTQTLQDIAITLQEIITLNPKHVSVYSLILEKGTPLYKSVEEKELYLPSEDLERQMYWKVKERLEKEGYIHYEISNFSKKGFESKHNLACWNQEEYIGLGVSAHSYLNDTRYSNTENIEEYIEMFKLNKNKRKINEVQNKQDKMKEYMMLGLRKIEGVKISEFKNKFVDNPIYLFRESLSKLVMQRLIAIEGDKIKLTKKGIDLANLVWEEFV